MQTRITRSNDFLLQRSRAGWFEGTVLFVNKKNQKNFRRMLRILKLPMTLISVRALRDSFYFGSLPKSLNRFFKRGARCNKRPPAVARTRLPGRCAHRAFYCQPLPHVLCPRADGNLIQTRITRLNDFLLQRSRAVELSPA